MSLISLILFTWFVVAFGTLTFNRNYFYTYITTLLNLFILWQILALHWSTKKKFINPSPWPWLNVKVLFLNNKFIPLSLWVSLYEFLATQYLSLRKNYILFNATSYSFIIFLLPSIIRDKIDVEFELWDFESRMREVHICKWERNNCFNKTLLSFCIDEIFFYQVMTISRLWGCYKDIHALINDLTISSTTWTCKVEKMLQKQAPFVFVF